jgi:3-hydroxyisobutyrate/3-hydroxypropionate dehydrogenase
MAKNLRQKLPKEDSLYIHDVNTDVLQKFVKEHSGQSVAIRTSAREIAELSVCSEEPLVNPMSLMSIIFPLSSYD